MPYYIHTSIHNTSHIHQNLRSGEAPSSLLSNPLLRIISSDEATLGETVYIGGENEKEDCILCANPSKNKLMPTIIVEIGEREGDEIYPTALS